MKLTIESMGHATPGLETMKITGFTENELRELKSMEHYEAKDALLDMLDRRNDGIATWWHNGNGIYGVWFDNEAAYLNVGTSSD